MQKKKLSKMILSIVFLILAIIAIIAIIAMVNSNNVKYEFTSADQAAVQGYPKILKIFKLSDSEMKFAYNSGFDFSKSTIDREITGTAKANAEQIYEFEEVVDGHRYKLTFEFDESKETVKVCEFDNDNELGWINLFR